MFSRHIKCERMQYSLGHWILYFIVPKMLFQTHYARLDVVDLCEVIIQINHIITNVMCMNFNYDNQWFSKAT